VGEQCIPSRDDDYWLSMAEMLVAITVGSKSAIRRVFVGFAFNNEMAQQTFAVATHLIHCYLATCSGLRELGILRTEPTLQGDYAEWLVGNFWGCSLRPVLYKGDTMPSTLRGAAIK
jgi:hypothetical protein